MRDGEDESATRAQHAPHRRQRRLQLGDVHQREVTGEGIETCSGQRRQSVGVVALIRDAERRGALLLPCDLEQALREVDTRDVRTAPR